MSASGIADLVKGELDAPFWEGWSDGETIPVAPVRCVRASRLASELLHPTRACAHGMGGNTRRGRDGHFHNLSPRLHQRACGEVPYTVAVVRFDEGPYFHTRLVGIAPEAVKSGMRVRVRRGAGDEFPLFVAD